MAVSGARVRPSERDDEPTTTRRANHVRARPLQRWAQQIHARVGNYDDLFKKIGTLIVLAS